MAPAFINAKTRVAYVGAYLDIKRLKDKSDTGTKDLTEL